MALKGSATIELTNVDGSKQVIKHDNMITDAVSDMLRSYMGDMPLIHKADTFDNSYINVIFGGILLFGDKLSDDTADYYIPNANITGYANNKAYTGLDLSRGSRNIAESGWQEDGSYKFVYDFSTHQANGNIQSIALCPIQTGSIGASDAPVLSEYAGIWLADDVLTHGEGKGAWDSFRLFNGYVDGISSYSICPIAIIGDYIYAININNIDYNYNDRSQNLINNGGILYLYKFRYQFNNVNITDIIGRAKYIETIEVKIPDEIINLAYTYNDGGIYGVLGLHFNKRDGKLIAFPFSLTNALGQNGNMPYVEIDINDNMSVTNKTFTNTTNQSLATRGVNYLDSGGSYGFYVLDDHILMIGGLGEDARMYVIDRVDNTKVVKIKIGGSDFIPYNSNYNNGINFDIKVANKNTVVVSFRKYRDNNPYDMYIIDLTTGVAKKCNTTSNSIYSNVIGIKKPIMKDRAIIYDAGRYLGCTPRLNPFILTTKNNLDQPIVKTSSQTMKITYTLTESEGA